MLAQPGSSAARGLLLAVVAPALATYLVCRVIAGDRAPEPSPEELLGMALDEAIARARERAQVRRALAEAVVRGELPLREAARRLREFDAVGGRVGCGAGADLMRHFPGRTEEERYARCVVHWARAASSEAARRALPRLERELAEAYGAERPRLAAPPRGAASRSSSAPSGASASRRSGGRPPDRGQGVHAGAEALQRHRLAADPHLSE
jgi:hypothetical protein